MNKVGFTIVKHLLILSRKSASLFISASLQIPAKEIVFPPFETFWLESIIFKKKNSRKSISGGGGGTFIRATRIC